MTTTDRITILIASWLDPLHIETIRAVSPRLHVVYRPELLSPERYPNDRRAFQRSAADETEWRGLLADADILFDFDYTNRQELPDLAPRVRWIQASFAGIGQFVRRMGYDQRMPHTVFTTASGIHAQPLAEFCTMVMLMHSVGYARLREQQAARHWAPRRGTDLAGRTIVIVGAGNIGAQIARHAQVLGMHVVGLKREVVGIEPASLALDELHPPERLADLLPRAEFLVLAAPHTSDTEHLIGATELALLPDGAVLINVGRGALIDEAALVVALQSGRLAGAGLDVFAQEPLPDESPLWQMPQVVISPHSAGISDREGQRLTALFCDNIRRYLAGAPLINQLDLQLLY
jgi:glyoxylate/hydroxypyruvate reductase A